MSRSSLGSKERRVHERGRGAPVGMKHLVKRRFGHVCCRASVALRFPSLASRDDRAAGMGGGAVSRSPAGASKSAFRSRIRSGCGNGLGSHVDRTGKTSRGGSGAAKVFCGALLFRQSILPHSFYGLAERSRKWAQHARQPGANQVYCDPDSNIEQLARYVAANGDPPEEEGTERNFAWQTSGPV